MYLNQIDIKMIKLHSIYQYISYLMAELLLNPRKKGKMDTPVFPEFPE